MTSTTHPDFNASTEGLEVAKAFAHYVRGKTAIVTGVNPDGIGFTTAEALASQSLARLIIAGRSPLKLQKSVDLLRAKFPAVDYRTLQIDLSSQASVRAAAAEVLSWPDVPGVDILVNSAGVMGVPERTLTEDGIEMHFATNHIGHWLFTNLIVPKLAAAAEGKPRGSVRVVNVSSGSSFIACSRFSDINFEKRNRDLPKHEQPPSEFMRMWGYEEVEDVSYIPIDGYNRSKVANVLFGIAANKRWYEQRGILTLAVHPGVIPTELIRDFPQKLLDAVAGMSSAGLFTYKTLGAGSATGLVAALDPKLGVGESRDGEGENYGAILVDCQISAGTHPLAVSSEEAEKLWDISEKLVEEAFS